MALQPKQSEFVRAVGKLIQFLTDFGLEATFGDAYRDPRATFPYGAENSKHKKRLAIDLILFRNGEYLTETRDYEPAGIYWETIGGIWGGRFSSPDGNHFEWPE